MLKRTFVLMLACAAVSAPASAQISFGVNIGSPPPMPIYEPMPPPRHGYTWAPGYWRWERDRHVWEAGHWVPARAGYYWVPDRWIHHEHGGYVHVPGHWER